MTGGPAGYIVEAVRQGADFVAVVEERTPLRKAGSRLQGRRLFPTPEVNRELEARGTAALKAPTPVLSLLKRPQVDLATLYRLSGEEPLAPPAVVEQLEIKNQDEGYIQRQEAEAKKFAQGEGKSIPPDFDYDKVPGLSLEIREKLKQVRPRSLGQAARVSGVTPAALAILMVYLKRRSSLRNQEDQSCES